MLRREEVPIPIRWRTDRLPNGVAPRAIHSPFLSRGPDLNRRPRPYQGRVPPLNYHGLSDTIKNSFESCILLCLSSSNHTASCLWSNPHSLSEHVNATSLACWMASSRVIMLIYLFGWVNRFELFLWDPQSHVLTANTIPTICNVPIYGLVLPEGFEPPTLSA